MTDIKSKILSENTVEETIKVLINDIQNEEDLNHSNSNQELIYYLKLALKVALEMTENIKSPIHC